MNQEIRKLFVQHVYTKCSRKCRRGSVHCDLLRQQGVFGGQKRETSETPSLCFYNTFAPKLEGRCVGKAEGFVSPQQKES